MVDRLRQYGTDQNRSRGALEDQRVQHQNSMKDNILKLSISCFKNCPRISGAIHDLVNDTAYQFMSIGYLSHRNKLWPTSSKAEG